MEAIYNPKPDILLRCGRLPNANFVTDPLVFVEVLSPSTMDFDRGAKLAFYKQMPTPVHVALVCQDEMRVEHYRRQDAGWAHSTHTSADDHVVFDGSGAAFTLADACFGVFPAFSEAPPA